MAEKLGTTPAVSVKLGAGDALMLLTALLFGSSFPIAKAILPVMDSSLFATSRYALAALTLFGWLALRRQKLGLGQVNKKALLFCVLSFAGFQLSWAYTLSLTNASVGAIFVATSPLWGTILATIDGHRLRPIGWFGIALAFCGVALVINNSLDAITVNFGSLFSSLLWLFTAFLWAFFVAKSPPLVQQMGATRMFAWVMILAVILMTPVAIWRGWDMQWGLMTPLLWTKFFYTAFFTAALALALWNIGLARLGVTRTMIYMYLVPLFAITIAVLFLGEHMTPARWIGAAAVLSGIAITRRAAS